MIKKKNKLKKLTLLTLILITGFSAGIASARTMTEYPRVRLQSLDKATARTMTFEARVGSTLKFGPLYIRVQSCQKSSPIDEPESAAFIQIWEVDTEDNAEWVFSGWMFASSPALSPMDHPIYDVWVLDCLDAETAEKAINTIPIPDDGENDVPAIIEEIDTADPNMGDMLE